MSHVWKANGYSLNLSVFNFNSSQPDNNTSHRPKGTVKREVWKSYELDYSMSHTIEIATRQRSVKTRESEGYLTSQSKFY